MSEGQLPPVPRLEEIARVSPSRFVALTTCALHEALAANQVPPSLPRSPLARLGTVIHKLLEDAAAGRLSSDEEIQARWDELVGKQESQMSETWLERHFAPLRTSIGSYDERRLQALARAAELASAAEKHGTNHGTRDRERAYGTELWVQNAAGDIGGSIDAVIPSSSGPVIRDYKSGSIRGDDGALKPEYAAQLKLYAAAYAEDKGAWPTVLELVTLTGEPHEVPFSRPECQALLEHASNTLSEVNAHLADAGDDVTAAQYALASPSTDACRFCEFRPSCQPYHDSVSAHQGLEQWPGDAWGIVVERKSLLNGKDLLRLALHGDERRIRGITRDATRQPALALMEEGTPAEAFNLRVLGPRSFEERSSTVLYARATLATVSARPGG